MKFQQCSAGFISVMLIRSAALFHHWNSSARRELAHCRWKIGMLVIHDEAKNGPARATAEAMKGLTTRTDDERRRLFLVKRAEGLEIYPGTLEWKIRTDHFDNIVRRSN